VGTPAVLSETPTSVLIVWSEPELPNGELTSYGIERRLAGEITGTNIAVMLPDDPKQYIDNSPDVTPYTSYEYRISVSNSAGITYSDWVEVTTMSASKS